MATYIELFNLRDDSDLRNKTAVAVVVAAEQVRLEADTTPNHANRLLWSKAVFENPIEEATRMLWVLLAGNKSLTVAQIKGASDIAMQTKVDAAVDLFAVGV